MGRRLLQLIAAVVVCSALPMLVGGCVPGAGTVVTAPVKQGAKEIAQVAEKRAVAEATEKAGREAEKAGREAAEKMARDRATRETLSVKEEAARLKAGLPLGRGHTGRWEPGTLQEKRAMDKVRADPASGETQKMVMNDDRWHAKDGWVKKRQIIDGVVIHYVFNTRTGAFDDLKFK